MSSSYQSWWFHSLVHCQGRRLSCSLTRCPPGVKRQRVLTVIFKNNDKKRFPCWPNSIPKPLANLLGLLAVGHGAGGIPARLQRQVIVPLHQSQVVARSQVGLQEEGGADAAQLAVGDDGDAIAQDVGLVHVVSGQEDGAACRRTNALAYQQHDQKEQR